MGNDIQKGRGSSMQRLQAQEQRLAHAEWIAGRVVTMLAHYFQPDDDEAVTAMLMADWVEALQGYPQDVISKAVKGYIQTERRRPTIADISQRCRGLMPTPKVVSCPPPQEAPRVTAEKRQEIVEAAGITNPTLRKVLRGETFERETR